MTFLPVERAADPWCGPRVLDDAQQCPAKAATALHGWAAPRARRKTAPIGGAWLATVTLLEQLAQRGPTSAFVRGGHPVTDLHRFATQVLPGQVPEVQAYAADTAEQLLNAQA